MFLNISAHGKSSQVINATENNVAPGKKGLPEKNGLSEAAELSDNSITVFHLAASVGDMGKLRTCGYVDIPDAMGCTPLHYAVSGHQMEAVKYLVSCGADCHKMASNGTTPISMAKMLGDNELLEVLRRSPNVDPLDEALREVIASISCNHPPNRVAGSLKKLAVVMLGRDMDRNPPSPLASECLGKLKQWGRL